MPYLVPALSLFVVLIIVLIFWLRERANNNIKKEFITIVTHEFRTPLTKIKWATETLQKDLTFQEKEDLLKEMSRASNRLMEIVNMLVGFVKFDNRLEYAYEATSLRELIEETIQKHTDLIRKKKINLVIDQGYSLPLIVIDRTKIQFVIDSIFSNALQYTPIDGRVEIHLSNNTKTIDLVVSDSGSGIDRREMKKIFRQFYRGKVAKTIDTEGMGMSLYVSRRIVEGHKGKIRVESGGRNKGATFTVSLPKIDR